MLKWIASLFLVLLFVPAAVLADEQGAIVAPTVEERIQALEKANAELYHTLSEKKEAGLASRLAERFSLSGLLEVEAAVERLKYHHAASDSASDLTLATAQLVIGAKVTEEITADLSFLYEEGQTDLEVDEAAVNFAFGPWSGRLGQQYLPFGVFHSHFISDPLTLALGETRDTALLAGYGNDLFNFSGFFFNGRADEKQGEDHLDDWGASLTLMPAEGLSLGGSFLSDLGDSNAELLADDAGDSGWRRRVGAWSAYALWEKGRLDLSWEVLGSVRAFHSQDLDADADGKGDQPLAWNVEAAWDLRENLELAFRLEGSREFSGEPARQYGVDLSWAPWERVSLSLEYLRGTFDRGFAPIGEESGAVADRRDLVTAQVGVAF